MLNKHTTYAVDGEILVGTSFAADVANQKMHDEVKAEAKDETLVISGFRMQAVDNGCYCVDAITQQKELDSKTHNNAKGVIAETLNINLHKSKVNFMAKPGMPPYLSGDFKRTLYRPELFDLLKDIDYGLDWCENETMASYIYNKYLYYDPVFWGTVNDVDGMVRTAYFMQDKANRIADYYNHLNDLRQIVLDSGLGEDASYNPIHNYDKHEVHSGEDVNTQTGKVTTSNDGNYGEFPMQSYDKKLMNETHNEGETSYDDVQNEFAHGHVIDVTGNIGVTTTAQMLAGEIDIMDRLLRIVDMYVGEFKEFFWLNM